MTPDREVRPIGRYDWESIIRRARLGTVIPARKGKNGKVTKGGMSGTLFTGIALGWSSYADADGSRVKPGDATVAVALETSIAAVRAVRQALIDLGLLQQAGPRRKGHGIEYRLTVPSDLLDRLEVLTPAQHTLAANRLRDAARGKPSSGWPSGVPELGGPVEYPETGEPTALGGPVDNPNASAAETPGWSSGTTENPFGWSSGTSLGSPVDTHTVHRPSTSTTGHSGEDVRTAVTVSRARRCEDQIPRINQAPVAIAVLNADEPGRPAPEPAPAALAEPKPPTPTEPATVCPRHGLPIPAGEPRADGKPRCTLCRRGAPPTRTAAPVATDPHALPSTEGADAA